MTTFKVVPDVLREREPLVRGRIPRNPLSKALLGGQTVWITGKKQTWGSLYTLAKNHNKQCKTKRTVINGEEGTLAWFEERRKFHQVTIDEVEEKHGPYGPEGYCYCGEFVGHNGDWSRHETPKIKA